MQAMINMLLSNAVLASALAIAVFAVTKIWNNHFAAHALWLLVLVKLLTPPLVGVLPPGLIPGLVQSNIVHRGRAMQSHPADPRDKNQLLIEDTQDPQNGTSNQLQPAVNRHEPTERQLSLSGIVLAIWLAGSVVWCLVASYRLTRFARLLRQHGSDEERIQMMAKKVAAAMRLRRCPQLVLTPAKVPPFVWAAWRPALLVLPRDLVMQLDPDQLETLLAHELAHLRRGDHWIRRYEMVVAAIYWWHPVVWWAVHELRIAEEKCCDALVVHRFPNQIQQYGEVLLRVAEFACSPVPRAAIPIGQGNQLKERVNMILNQAFSPRLSRSACLGLFVVAIASVPLAVPGMELAAARPQPSVSVGGLAELEEEPGAAANEEPARKGVEDSTASSTSPSKSKQLLRRESLRRRALLSRPKMSFGGPPDDKQVHLRVPLTVDMVEELAGTENLGTVFLSREAGDHDLLLLKQVRMKTLFAEADITDRGVKALENHPTLETLHLRKPIITDNSFRSLSHIPRLTKVRIYDAQISDEALRFVAESTGTEHLMRFEFSQCPKLTSRMLKHIAKITSLTELTLVDLQDLDEEDLNYLATMKNLEDFILLRSPLTDKGLVHISRMTWLKTLHVHYTDVNGKGLESIVRLKNLRSLGMPRANITDQGVALIATELPKLHRLSLPKTQITDAAVKHITKLTEMRNLTLTETRITNAAMAHVAKLTKLETLSMTGTAVRDEGLQHLDGLKNLTVVWATASQEERERFERVHPGVYLMPRPRAPRPRIGYTESEGLKNAHLKTQLTAEMVDELKRLDNLRTVFLSHESDDRDMIRLADLPMIGIAGWAPAITDRGIKALENHPTLESFNLFESSITDLGLKSIPRIPRLTKVHIDKVSITDEGVRELIQELSKAGQVKNLGFYKCQQLTDHGLQQIGQLVTLERLFLNNNDGLTSGILREIAKLRNLNRLELDGITLNETDLVHLAALTKLETLGLSCSKSNPELTDRGLAYVSRLPSLQSLTVHDAKITDVGLEHLKGLSSLETLNLRNTQVTDKGITALEEALPNCKIAR